MAQPPRRRGPVPAAPAAGLLLPTRRLPRTVLVLPLLLAALLAAPPASAAAAPWAQGLSRASDLVVKLVTVEPGTPLYSWWGHTGLIVEDPRLGVSRFYNYGLFSIQKEDFVRNFIQGRLWFEVGASSTERELRAYRSDNRTIRIQTLDLVPERRLRMAEFLEWNILPENRTYLYDHYRDNCATRVRDLLDRMVDGQLASATAVPGRGTLRWHTRRFTAGHTLMNWLLMFLMSGVIDRPITRWQEMFLPMELERDVAGLRYLDPQGRERALVSAQETWFTAADRAPVPERPPSFVPPALGLGALLGLIAAALGWWRAGRVPEREGGAAGRGVPAGEARSRGGRAAGRALSGAWEALLGLCLGLMGTVLAYMSLFTDHTVTYGNRNLFLANPLHLAVVPLAVALAAGARWAGRWLAGLWSLLAALGLLSLALQTIPALRQDNWVIAALLLPVELGCAAGGWLGRFRKSS
jgi:hypothetical protein